MSNTQALADLSMAPQHTAELCVPGATKQAKKVARRRRDERGMTTAEYAVGTVAAASFGGVLIKILTDPQLRELIISLIRALLEFFMKVNPL